MSSVLAKKSSKEPNDGGFTPVKHWASIEGLWRFARNTGAATFLGGATQGEESLTFKSPIGLALAAGKIRDGILCTTVKAEKSETLVPTHLGSWSHGATAGILFGFQNTNARYFAAVLGGFDRAYGLLMYEPAAGWRSLTASGTSTNLEVGEEYRLELEIRGQSISLTVDGVEVIDSYCLSEPFDGTGFGLFAWGSASFAFKDSQSSSQPPEVFVVMPFNEPYDTLYRAVIQRVAKREGFLINRVDEIRGPGNILEDIRRQIESSHVVVAEISTHNPNVFYEVGYAHALKKPVILLARRGGEGDLPFDLRPYRVIFYDDTIGGKQEVERALRDHLRSVLR
jgi:hypothetical protein